MRRAQIHKLEQEDFVNFSRKERIQMINEYSHSIYTLNSSKATNRLALVALLLTGFTSYIAFENLLEAKRAAAARSVPAKVIVMGIPTVQMSVTGGMANNPLGSTTNSP
jgi:hypothetical protein